MLDGILQRRLGTKDVLVSCIGRLLNDATVLGQ